jgi:iron complex outermembrane receptor protein
VGFLVDDFALSHVQSQFVELFDIKQIEVYRGPQGTLFGKNTTGGVISIETIQPEFNEFSGYVEGDYGQYDNDGDIWKTKVALNIPLIEDTLAFRFAGIYDKTDGYYTNDKDTATFPEFIPLFAAFGLPAVNPPLPPELDTTHVGNGDFIGGKDVFAAKAKLRWTPTDWYELLFTYEYVKDRSDSPPGVNETPTGEGFLIEAQGFPGIQAAGHDDPFSTGVTNTTHIGINVGDGHQVDVDGYYLTQLFELDRFDIKSITGWRNSEEILPSTYTGEAYATYFDATRSTKRDQFQQELRLISNFTDSPFDFVAGAAYFKDDVFFVAMTSVGLQTLLPIFNADNGSFYDDRGFVNLDLDITNTGAFQSTEQERKTWAAYFDGTFEVNDKWSIGGGLRYTDDKKEFSRLIDGGGVCNQYTRPQDAVPIDPDEPMDPPNNVNCIDVRSNALSRAGLTGPEWDQQSVPLGRDHFGVDVLPKKDWDKVTWRVVADYRASDDIMMYGSIATGFQSGGFTETCSSVRTCIPFEPETNINYEIGMKSDLADNTVRFNASLFYTKYKDLQRNQVVPYTNSLGNETQETITINSGKSTAWGTELELTWVPIENLRVDASVGYQHHKYDEFILELVVGVPEDLSHLTPPFSPKWQLYGGVTYDGPEFSNGGSLVWNGSLHYQSTAEMSVFNSTLSQLESRTLFTASVSYRSPGDRWFVSLWGRNLFNETHRVSANSVAGLWNFTQYGAPREIGIRGGVSF